VNNGLNSGEQPLSAALHAWAVVGSGEAWQEFWAGILLEYCVAVRFGKTAVKQWQGSRKESKQVDVTSANSIVLLR
jgi:hypothetical protein